MDVQQLFSGSANKFVYLLGDEGAVLVYLEKDVVIRRLFAPTPAPEHTNTFLDLFRAHPKAPIYVLVDMIDQSYVRHTLPPVTPLGVGKLVQRRLERDFSKDDIKGALSLGREKEGRKDWNFLLIALANTPSLQNWLNLVLELPNYFAGIYLVPVEMETIIPQVDAALNGTAGTSKKKEKKKGIELSFSKKKKEAPEPTPEPSLTSPVSQSELLEDSPPEWKIIVTHNKVGGFRQVVLRKDKLVFTRLAQTMDNTNPEVLAGSVEQEILNTIEYLKRLGFSPRMRLDLYVICSQEVKDAISTERLGATKSYLLSPFDIGEKMGLKQAVLSGDRFADIVLATIFGISSKKRLQLNVPYTQNIKKFEMIRALSKVGAALVSLLLIGMTVTSLLDYQSIESDISAQQQQKVTKAAELAQMQEQSKDLPADVDQVTDIIAMVEMLSDTGPTPLEFITRLREAISQPDVVVSSLAWQRQEEAQPPFFNPTTGVQETPPPLQKYVIALQIEFLYTDATWQDFIARTTAFVSHMETFFSEYDIKAENLPGDIPEATSAQVNFDDIKKINNRPAKGDAYTISLELTGPKPEKPAVDANGNPLPGTP